MSELCLDCEQPVHLHLCPDSECRNRNHAGLESLAAGHRQVDDGGKFELVPLHSGPQDWMGQDVALLAQRIKDALEASEGTDD